jgi:predicted permease
VGNFLVVVTFAVFVITGKIDWRMLYKFPPLGALVLAFLTKPVPITLLKPFVAVVKNSITPTILFSVGLRFEPREAFKNLKLAALAVLWRQLVVPSFVFFLLILISRFAEFPKTELAVILLQSATPPFVMSVILSEKFKLNADLAVAAVNLGLLFLLISLPLWYRLATASL